MGEGHGNMIFLIIFGVGLSLTLLAFLIGEIFDLADIGGSDSLGGDPSPFSSRVIFVFMTAFGGVGFIGQSAGWGIPLSALAGVVGGLAVAGGTFFLIILPMSRQQGSVKFSLEDLIDLEGEVVDDIPAGGTGRVAFLPPGTGTRVSRAARSQNGAHIPPGTVVRVVHVGPSSVTVTPAEYFSSQAPGQRR
jgi:membrane-bound ClpP family serine protease